MVGVRVSVGMGTGVGDGEIVGVGEMGRQAVSRIGTSKNQMENTLFDFMNISGMQARHSKLDCVVKLMRIN